MTGSWDRTVRTWDLDQRTCVRTLKGNVVNDGVWMTHWLCHIVGYDEASTIGKNFLLYFTVRPNGERKLQIFCMIRLFVQLYFY